MLRYLHFEQSEADQGHVSYEAMATVPKARWTELEAELLDVLRWAHQAGEPGPLDEGHEWDVDLNVHREQREAQRAEADLRQGTVRLSPLGAPVETVLITLVISGGPAFAADFETRFPLD